MVKSQAYLCGCICAPLGNAPFYLLNQLAQTKRMAYLKQFEEPIKVTYTPLCSGDGALPSAYQELTFPKMREITSSLEMMTKLSHFNLLSYIHHPDVLNKEINGLKISDAGKEDLLNYRKVYNAILEILSDVLGICAAFGVPVSIKEVQDVLGKMYTGFWTPSQWWLTISNLGNVMGIEMDQLKWAKRSRSGREPRLAECGVHVATINGYTLGSIWTFSDPRMVSKDGATRYIFVQGIRSSVAYIIARMLRPDQLPPVSKVLIDSVEKWAYQQGVNAIRINPIGSMIKILTQYHGFQSISPEMASHLSPFLQDELKQNAVSRVIKYL